jgi:hypothetical protein
MLNRFFTFVVLLCLSLSCSEEDCDPQQTCSMGNPVEEIPALANIIQEWANAGWEEYIWVTQANYQNEVVFIVGNCCPFCDSFLPVYNCAGEQIGIVYDTIDARILDNDILIWKAENSTCTF